jgi:nondiscriminating aspartyl-tRNA synthetase
MTSQKIKCTDRLKDSVSSKAKHAPRSLPQRVRLNNRIVDLRTTSSQSVFRIQSGIGRIFRGYLDERGFIEIHTPKLQPAATESGSSVFEVKYFGRPAFLAQSPQLAKQMSIAADFERVYEVGPVFRAEDSNTPRHLTEYTGLDIEMALDEHYHEALDIIDGMFKHLWRSLYEQYANELDIISKFYPHEKVLWLEKTPRIPFWEGIQMLVADGWVDEDGNPPKDSEDLATRAEIRLGQLVREKYKTDYYILDKFPAAVRPFYTMPDPTNPKFSNSFDIFMRGQEILSGGQRIHDAKFLEEQMRKAGVKPEYMEEYMEGFRWGAPPHAGAGIGLERLTFLFLNLGNIRLASLFPRDPKSLPARPQVLSLRHPEASTILPPWLNPAVDHSDPTKTQLQPLEKLIANYGDAANTAWLDDQYEIWRHQSTGAAQGFVVHDGFAIAVGEPLCDKSQHPQVVSAFLNYIKTDRKELKLVWMIVGPQIEEYLGEKFNWRTLSAMAEERADPRNNPAIKNPDLARKVRHAEQENVKNIEWPKSEKLPQDLKDRIDERCRDWKKNRKGQQVHLTEIRPWVDEEHRRYFYAAEGNKDGKIHAIVVMHQLSPQNGYQMKFSLEFPGAPSGTIESLTLHAMAVSAGQDPDLKQVTFGTGAMGELAGGRNVGKNKLKVLKKTYDTINKSLKLTNKSEFREKLGAKDERVYIAYPRGGLGPMGIKAILGFLEG